MMDVSADFKSFQEQVSAALVATTRTAALIANDDLDFHRAASSATNTALDGITTNLLSLTNKLFKAATQDSALKPPRIKSVDGLEDKWRQVVEVFDDLLEKADTARDEYSGIIKRLTPDQDGTVTPPVRKERQRKRDDVFDDPSMRKPQLDFLRPVDNFTIAPFKPLLQRKPHSKVPLEKAIGDGNSGRYDHPYAAEIEQCDYPASTYQKASPIPYTPPTASQPIMVDTGEALQSMLAELKKAKEIAIDIEHHDMHSYVGIVCLMQISTRQKDWIVDTTRPWREELQILNQVFADPNILKVLHGSTMDVVWLQRDLGLYIVGLFDTYHACEALRFPRRGLAYLLDRFVNFPAEKKYQMADWRIRPLPEELIDYARSDTHYLLYIYDQMRNMLVDNSTPDQNLIHYVLENSKKEALQTYERPIYDVENGLGSIGWFKVLVQRAARLDQTQFAVFRALHRWRDEKARTLDEGEQFILPLAALWTLSEGMPVTIAYLHGCLRPMPKSFHTKEYKLASEIVEIIKQAKKDGLNGPTVLEVFERNKDKYKPNHFRQRTIERAPQSSLSGVGDTLERLRTAPSHEQNGKEAPHTTIPQNTLNPRCTTSHLWGSALAETALDYGEGIPAAAAVALRAVLPLPAVSDLQILESPDLLHIQATAQPQAVDLASPDTVPETNKAFVLRDTNQSRKRKNSDLATPNILNDPPESSKYALTATANGMTPDMPEIPHLEARIRARFKAERRSEKQRLRAEAEALATVNPAPDDLPFDYNSAPSMLQSAAINNTTSSVKEINPYLKALDTSTGAKRPKHSKEQPGRSMTFKP